MLYTLPDKTKDSHCQAVDRKPYQLTLLHETQHPFAGRAPYHESRYEAYDETGGRDWSLSFRLSGHYVLNAEQRLSEDRYDDHKERERGYLVAFVSDKYTCGDCSSATAETGKHGDRLGHSYCKGVGEGYVSSTVGAYHPSVHQAVAEMRECKKTSGSQQTDTDDGEVACEEILYEVLETEPYDSDRNTTDENLDDIPEIIVTAESEETLAQVSEKGPENHYRAAHRGCVQDDVKLQGVVTFELETEDFAEDHEMSA